MSNKLRVFTPEHREKISISRKKMFADGYVPYNKGLKTSDRDNGTELLHKNMLAHLRFEVSLTWLIQFGDVEKLKCLNRAITKRGDRWDVSTEWYKAYIEKFYTDSQFNEVFTRWSRCKNDKYLRPTIDHIEAKAGGGGNELRNLQFLSWFENRAKNDMAQTEWNALKSNIKNYLI